MTEDGKAALKRALNMVAYAPNTAAQLRRKLMQKGVRPEAAAEAIEYLERKGYLNETEYLYRLVSLLGNKKCYGPRRIREQLRQKGFAREIIENEFSAACEQVDFVDACRRQLHRKNCADADKLIAAMLRYGFDYATIREAMKRELAE